MRLRGPWQVFAPSRTARPNVAGHGGLQAPLTALAINPGVAGVALCDTVLRTDFTQPQTMTAGTPCFVQRPTQEAAQAVIEAYTAPAALCYGARNQEFTITARGRAAADSVRLRRHTDYQPTQEPLFTGPPSWRDVVQGQSRVCALAASVLAQLACHPQSIVDMMRDHGDGSVTVRLFAQHNGAYRPVYHRVAKSIPSPRGKAALWYVLLEKAVAVHGWPANAAGIISHAQKCSGGFCDDFLPMLTGHHAWRSVCDFTSLGYNLSLLLDVLTDADNTWTPPGLTPCDVAAVQKWVQRTPHLCKTLEAGTFTPHALNHALIQLGLVGTHHGVNLSAARPWLIQSAEHAASHMNRTNDCTPMEQYMGAAIAHRVQACQPVCFSTRLHLPQALEPRRRARTADILLRYRCAGYAWDTHHDLARGGMQAAHAYAIHDVRQSEHGMQFLLTDPAARAGRTYTTLGGKRLGVASTESHFWIDLHDLFRYAAALYFGE